MNWLKVICTIFIIFSFIVIGSAEDINIHPVDNSYIDSLNPDMNYGNDEFLKTWYASNKQQKAYLTFYVPEYSDSATINVYLQNYGGSHFRIYRTTTDWSESEITYSYGRPIIESSTVIDEVPNNGSEKWYSFNVSSVVDEPGYYSFCIATQWGYKNEFNSTRAETNRPYMHITTTEAVDDIVFNSKTKDDSYSFMVSENEDIAFYVEAPDADQIVSYDWFVNKNKQVEDTNSFDFTVPSGDISQPSSCIWEIRVEGLYENDTRIIREWLISSLTEDQAPDFIDYFIDRDNRWRNGFVLDPWGRQFPSYNQPENLISNGYYSASETSTGKVLSSKFNITDGTFKYKIRNPGALTVSYFKVEGEPEPRYKDNSLMAPSWRYELTASEFHDYFSILNYRIGFGDDESRYSWGSYIPISRRWLGQAPGFQWWKGDDWREITIVKTSDGWWSIWENGVLVPYSYANFEDAFNNATKLTLASNGILEMDCIEVYEDKYIYPETDIKYGTYAKWWRLTDTTNNGYSPVDSDGIIVSGKNVSLQQIADIIDNSDLISYDSVTRTAVLKTDLSLVAGSELIIDNETIIVDTSFTSRSIDIKPGVTFKVLNSKITATEHPLIWNVASSVSSEVFNPPITRNETASTGTSKNNPIYDFRGSFIVENSVIDNTANLFLDAPYEVVFKDTIFSNHSDLSYGDYTLRGEYENHNQKIRQSYGKKGLWIAPRIDLTTYEVSNITFVDSQSTSLKIIGGEWIQNTTTIVDSDLSQIDVLAMKALKHEYFVSYREKDEKSTLSLLNTLYDEKKLFIDGHLRKSGALEYDCAKINTKYYLDTLVQDNTGNKINFAELTLNTSNELFYAENLYVYRDYITDAFGPGVGGATNYGSDSPQNDTYNGGTHTRWYNALPLGSATTDSTGHTSLPTSSDLNNSIVLIDFVLSNETGTLKKESLTYSMNVKTPDDQVITLSDIDPDPSWYREDPSVPTYTITAVIPDNTTGPHITGFAPAEDNQFTQGETKKFRVWTDEPLTTMKWYVDGNLVSTGSLQYNWTIAGGSHTVVFQGSNTGGTVVQSWSVSAESESPVLSSDGTTYTPSATSLAADIGDSTTFSISTDQPLMSLDWYVDDEPAESGVMEYTHEWSTAGIHSVRLEGDTGIETISNTWSVVVSEAGSSTISVLPSSAVVAPGDTFSLDVNIDPATSLSGSQFDMHYSSLASVDSLQEGELFSGSGL
jgi:hypothetical protein